MRAAGADRMGSMAPKARTLLLLMSLALTAHAQYSSGGVYNAVPTQVHIPPSHVQVLPSMFTVSLRFPQVIGLVDTQRF